MHVKELMTQPVVTCQVSDHLNVPARLMWDADCGSIPVLDDEGRLVGMVTDRDIAMAAYTQGTALDDITVDATMAKDVLAIHTKESIESVEHLMRDGQVRRVPVIDAERRPVGIVSLSDLTRATARARRSAEDRELVQTLAAVCHPRIPPEQLVAAKAAPDNLVARA